jgi:NAD(P)-dependent dehydrogenase (short-subunit alcohol dehydrogenase family)
MKGAVALVTGGAGHIGRETCVKLAMEGCNVVIVDKNIDAATKFAETLKKEWKVEAFPLTLDLMEPTCFTQAYEQVNKVFGKLDYLVNCAAFYDDTPGWGVPFEEETYEAWLKVLRVNTLAPFFLTQKLFPLLKNSKLASVVNVSSIYGLVGPDYGLYAGTDMTNPAVYGVSKGGLQQMTRWLSTVLAPTVRVNTVTPGGVERGQNPEFKARYEAKTPLKRMATEEEVADAIVYMLSPKAKYITGHNLVVDGGWTAW